MKSNIYINYYSKLIKKVINRYFFFKLKKEVSILKNNNIYTIKKTISHSVFIR